MNPGEICCLLQLVSPPHSHIFQLQLQSLYKIYKQITLAGNFSFHLASGNYTKISGVVMTRASEANIKAQETDQRCRVALVNALALRHEVKLIKHFKDRRARLMDYADNRPSTFRQILQQRNALQTG